MISITTVINNSVLRNILYKYIDYNGLCIHIWIIILRGKKATKIRVWSIIRSIFKVDEFFYKKARYEDFCDRPYTPKSNRLKSFRLFREFSSPSNTIFAIIIEHDLAKIFSNDKDVNNIYKNTYLPLPREWHEIDFLLLQKSA